MSRIILIILIILIGLPLVGLVYRDRAVRRDTRAAQFTAGTVPSPLPNGPYTGKVTGLNVSWQGKTFDAKEKTGINRFDQDDTVVTKYPFTTETGPGLREEQTTVLKIDYDLPENPWWLRRILDEIVQVSPGHYLGVVHYRFPFVSVSLGYFTLEK